MIMKTLIRTFILFFCITGLASCYVYRFLDLGNYVYFTTRGDVTSIKNDSTEERTITIYKDSIPNR